MLDTRLFMVDQWTGARTLFHGNEDGSFALETIEDVEPAIEANKALLSGSEGSWKGDQHLVASIPLSIYQDLMQRGITRDPEAMKKWLNDRDNRVFRTKAGIL